jgi:hypothetical protein
MVDDFVEFTDRIDFLDEAGVARWYYVYITDLNSAFVSFRTKAGNEVSIPWHRVLKVKRKGVLVNSSLVNGGDFDGG